jgi:hypothetical protein
MTFSWTTLDVRMNDGQSLEGGMRLAAMFLWLRGEASTQLAFVDPASGTRLTDPMAVNWRDFPLEEAIEASRAERELRSSHIECISRR